MKMSKDVMWFTLDGFEVGVDSQTNAVVLALYQVQVKEQEIGLIGSKMTPTQAERMANALLKAVSAARNPSPPSPSTH